MILEQNIAPNSQWSRSFSIATRTSFWTGISGALTVKNCPPLEIRLDEELGVLPKLPTYLQRKLLLTGNVFLHQNTSSWLDQHSQLLECLSNERLKDRDDNLRGLNAEPLSRRSLMSTSIRCNAITPSASFMHVYNEIRKRQTNDSIQYSSCKVNLLHA